MADSIDDLVRRPSQYWNEDGLIEIFVGLMALIPACLFGLAGRLRWVPAMLLPLAWIAVTLLLKEGLKRMKERVVSPRSGYIALASSRRVQWIGVAVFLLSGAVYTIARPFLHMDENWGRVPGLVVAVSFFASFLAGWVQARQAHLLILACAPLLAEIWIFRSGLGFGQAILWLLVAQGAALVVSGAVRFRSFLRANPRDRFSA